MSSRAIIKERVCPEQSVREIMLLGTFLLKNENNSPEWWETNPIFSTQDYSKLYSLNSYVNKGMNGIVYQSSVIINPYITNMTKISKIPNPITLEARVMTYGNVLNAHNISAQIVTLFDFFVTKTIPQKIYERFQFPEDDYKVILVMSAIDGVWENLEQPFTPQMVFEFVWALKALKRNCGITAIDLHFGNIGFKKVSYHRSYEIGANKYVFIDNEKDMTMLIDYGMYDIPERNFCKYENMEQCTSDNLFIIRKVCDHIHGTITRITQNAPPAARNQFKDALTYAFSEQSFSWTTFSQKLGLDIITHAPPSSRLFLQTSPVTDDLINVFGEVRLQKRTQGVPKSVVTAAREKAIAARARRRDAAVAAAKKRAAMRRKL